MSWIVIIGLGVGFNNRPSRSTSFPPALASFHPSDLFFFSFLPLLAFHPSDSSLLISPISFLYLDIFSCLSISTRLGLLPSPPSLVYTFTLQCSPFTLSLSLSHSYPLLARSFSLPLDARFVRIVLTSLTLHASLARRVRSFLCFLFSFLLGCLGSFSLVRLGLGFVCAFRSRVGHWVGLGWEGRRIEWTWTGGERRVLKLSRVCCSTRRAIFLSSRERESSVGEVGERTDRCVYHRTDWDV